MSRCIRKHFRPNLPVFLEILRIDSTLNAAAKLKSLLDCECPKHISDLIKTLSEFENYSTACSVENWHEAAVHSCIYAYTAQARYLMEKALQAALEGRGEELTKIMRSPL